MEPSQAYDLEQRQQRLKMSDAELLQLAREISPGCGCGMRSLADLTEGQSKQLIDVMDAIERSQVGTRMSQRELVA